MEKGRKTLFSRERLIAMVPEQKLKALKKEKDAVILAHYYVNAEVQALADYIGDSFYLSKVAAGLKEQTIVFAGVSFMGESAKVLSPQKTVLMPDGSADCPMAHMADVEQIQRMKQEYDDLAVVCYINSTVKLKQYADVCVTSANALHIVRALPNRRILFIPDDNLGHYIATQVPEKQFLYCGGYCPIHAKIPKEQVETLKNAHPKALVLAHPECKSELLELADYIGSTSGIIAFTEKSEKKEFIICTEIGVQYELERRSPDKQFYFPESQPVCQDMKLITPEKIINVLQTGENEVYIEETLAQAARKPLERMLELAQ